MLTGSSCIVRIDPKVVTPKVIRVTRAKPSVGDMNTMLNARILPQ